MVEKQSSWLDREGMERFIREKDWSTTSLGPMEYWPPTLLRTINLIMGINFPIVLCWGKNLITIYNDAYRPLLGNKSDALGRPFLEVWSEAKDIIEPQINQALNGDPVFLENAQFTLIRYGNPKIAWFDYSFSPIRDAEGNINGIINLAIEVTARVKAQKELIKLNKNLEKKVKKRTATLDAYKNKLRRLTYQLNKTKEQERYQHARILHDHVGQLLDVSLIELNLLKKSASEEDFLGIIEELKEVILEANKYIREFVKELKPPDIFEKENISALIRWLAQHMKKYRLKIFVDDDGKPKPLSEEVHKILYESTRELLFNIIKHADVEEAKILLRRENNRIQIIVKDAGKGFDFDGEDIVASTEGGFGLFNVQERMDMLGGSLEIESIPGEGTKAMLSAPLIDADQSFSQKMG